MDNSWTKVERARRPDTAEPQVRSPEIGADDGIRTRDPHLGKVVLYQLSHVRAAPILPGPYRTPVEPNPASPRLLCGSSATSAGSIPAKGTTTSWAIRSPFRISTG